MNNYLLSPYIRLAKFNGFPPYFGLAKRIIFDYELIYAYDGGARLLVDGKAHICRKNEVILLRPGVSHELVYLDDLKFVQPHIHFDLIYNKNSEITPICFKDKPDLTEKEFALIQEDILEKDIPYVFTPYKPEEFCELFFGVLSLYKERPQRFELSMKIKMLELSIQHGEESTFADVGAVLTDGGQRRHGIAAQRDIVKAQNADILRDPQTKLNAVDHHTVGQ